VCEHHQPHRLPVTDTQRSDYQIQKPPVSLIRFAVLPENSPRYRLTIPAFGLVLIMIVCLLSVPVPMRAQPVRGTEQNSQIERILLRGMTRMYVEDYVGAVSAFEAGLKLSPDNAVLLASIGTAKFGLGDAESAIFYVKRAIDVDPENSDYWQLLSELSLASGNVNEAITALEYVTQQSDASWLSRVQLVRLYVQMERLEMALQTADAGLQTDGNVPELLEARTDVLEALGRTREVIETLERHIAQVPDETELYFRLATAHIRLAAWSDAETALRALLTIDPEHREGLAALIEILSRQNEREEANRIKAQLDALEEVGAPVRGNAVTTLVTSSSADSAEALSIDELYSMLQINPENSELNMALADRLSESRDFLSAAKRYEQVALSDARVLDAWWKGIEAYVRAGKADKALSFSDEALLLFPGYTPVQIARVFALRAAGRVEEADALSRSILERDPNPQNEEHIRRLRQELDDA
jgi:tetratricopeptide (TPR) repeat protein